MRDSITDIRITILKYMGLLEVIIERYCGRTYTGDKPVYLISLQVVGDAIAVRAVADISIHEAI